MGVIIHLNKMKYCACSYYIAIFVIFFITTQSLSLRNKLAIENENFKVHLRQEPQYVVPVIRKSSINYSDTMGQLTPTGLKPRTLIPSASAPPPVERPKEGNPHKTAVNIAEEDSKTVQDMQDNALKQAKLYELAKKFADEAVNLEKQASTLTRSMQEATSLAQQARNSMQKSTNEARTLAETTMKESVLSSPVDIYNTANNPIPSQPIPPQNIVQPNYQVQNFNVRETPRMVQPITTYDNQMMTRMVPPTTPYNTAQNFGYKFQENNSIIKRQNKEETENNFSNNAIDDYVTNHLSFNNNI